MKKKLILGSSSPRRIELIGRFGFPFTHISPDVDETVEGCFTPSELVQEIALKKARALLESSDFPSLEDHVLLTADTIVVYNSEVIGKPKDRDAARETLRKLSGQTHQVYSAVCYVYLKAGCSEPVFEKQLCETKVLFKELSDEEIDSYVVTDEPYDKAGAYAIQGYSSYMVKEVHGSPSNVMGLPLTEVYETLKGLLA